MVLSYSYRRHAVEEWQGVEEPVRLTWTRCNYGGQRPWFICPGVVNGRLCQRRVAIFYRAGKYYLCRHCYQLAHASQRWGHADRLMEKARRIRMRLGGSANLLEPFPPKPKGMHWKTYWSLRTKSQQASLSSIYGMQPQSLRQVQLGQLQHRVILGGIDWRQYHLARFNVRLGLERTDGLRWEG